MCSDKPAPFIECNPSPKSYMVMYLSDLGHTTEKLSKAVMELENALKKLDGQVVIINKRPSKSLTSEYIRRLQSKPLQRKNPLVYNERKDWKFRKR